jgi:hypothetical protein
MRTFITSAVHKIDFFQDDQFNDDEMVGACRGEMINAYILVRKPERKRSLRRPRSKHKGNIKSDVKEVRCETLHWIHPACDRVL